MSFDYENDFASTEEAEEFIDSFIDSVKDQVLEEESKTSIINPTRVQQLLITYKILTQITKGTGLKITYKLYEPFKSMGAVNITGSKISFSNTSLFMKAVDLASNFEVYPKTNGTVQMNFTFHGLTKTIE